MNLMTTLEDLTDLEATAVITYVTALKVGPSPDELATIEAEEKASKEYAATTQAQTWNLSKKLHDPIFG